MAAGIQDVIAARVHAHEALGQNPANGRAARRVALHGRAKPHSIGRCGGRRIHDRSLFHWQEHSMADGRSCFRAHLHCGVEHEREALTTEEEETSSRG